ncbi:abl interactor 2 isoform X1 [Drosophila hydei]|uniref:Abl interactor 2 isoform X1 n=1 Tax=Drosophila hydei TaxID=7224 RepID=A0A6J1M786_DROHY|nr:abl interactor 2 isoform X1 [Drosophila hydei]
MDRTAIKGSMTIPSRPAPAPPMSRGQNAAAGANASLEQLRLQLQQQHLQQQQASNGGLQKLNIKLPPPPKGQVQQNNFHKKPAGSNNNYFDVEGSGSSITRKFPQARYTPTTNWNDAPFDGVSSTVNGNTKKMPPPRPPPPKVQINGQKLASLRTGNLGGGGGGGSGSSHSHSIISNIFHRKKSTATATAAASKVAAQSRVYGLSSGHSVSSTTTAATASATATASSNFTNNSNTYDWNAAWNTESTTTTTMKSSTSSHRETTEAQLISFDSPPSSPTFTQKSNSDCVSVDSFSSDSNFSSPNNGSVSQPESGFEDDYHSRSRPATQSPLVDPWEAVDSSIYSGGVDSFGTAPVRQMHPQLSARTSDNPLCNGKSLVPPAQSLTMPTIIKPKISQKPKAPKPPPFIGQPPAFAYGGYSTPPSPPMPKGAPPTLPAAGTSSASGNISLLDVISGKVDALALSNGSSGYVDELEVPYAIALYDFDGVEEGDLSFRENEKIYLVDQPTEEWFRGRSRTGCEGLFPVNYVEIKVPLGGNAAARATHAHSQPQEQPQHQQQQQLSTARCLYNFPGEVEGDLTLRENEVVNILYRINEDWLYGEVNGRQGQFPANFLEYVPDNIPTL